MIEIVIRSATFLAFGPGEWVAVGIVGVLLFGHRLPQVARSLGRGLVEFKKGIHDVQDEINEVSQKIEPEKKLESDN